MTDKRFPKTVLASISFLIRMLPLCSTFHVTRTRRLVALDNAASRLDQRNEVSVRWDECVRAGKSVSE